MAPVLTAQSIKDNREMEGSVVQTLVAQIKDFCRTDLARPAHHIAANRMREPVHLTDANNPQDKLFAEMEHAIPANYTQDQQVEMHAMVRLSIVNVDLIAALQTRSFLQMVLVGTAQLEKV